MYLCPRYIPNFIEIRPIVSELIQFKPTNNKIFPFYNINVGETILFTIITSLPPFRHHIYFLHSLITPLIWLQIIIIFIYWQKNAFYFNANTLVIRSLFFSSTIRRTDKTTHYLVSDKAPSECRKIVSIIFQGGQTCHMGDMF